MGKKRTLQDYFASSRINSALYVVIALLLFLSLYFVVVQFVEYKGLTANRVQVHIASNNLQRFSDGTHPVLTISVKTKQDSSINILVESDKNYSFINDDFVKEYTRLVVLPISTTGKEISITAFAENRAGIITKKTLNTRTMMAGENESAQDDEEVKFGIKKEVEFEVK